MTSLLSVLTGLNKGASQGTPKGEERADFPPLFGGNDETGKGADNVLPILRSILDPAPCASSRPEAKETSPQETYPYELQYNRPDIPHKKSL